MAQFERAVPSHRHLIYWRSAQAPKVGWRRSSLLGTSTVVEHSRCEWIHRAQSSVKPRVAIYRRAKT